MGGDEARESEREKLINELERKGRLYRGAQTGWSFLYHSAVFATPVVVVGR